MTTQATDGAIDHQRLYGHFQKGDDRWQRLYHRAAAKALNLAPEEDLNVTNTRNETHHHTGMSKTAAAMLAAAALLPSGIAGFLGYKLMNQAPAAATVPAVPSTPTAPAAEPSTPPSTPPPIEPVELEIEFKRRGGEWEVIPRRVE